MAKRMSQIDGETTPPPRLGEQGDAEAGEPVSAAAKMPIARAGKSTRGGVPGSTVAPKKRVTLTMSGKAAKRLSDYCHVMDINPGAAVEVLIMKPIHGIPRSSIRLETGTRDTGEDRQDEEAA